LPAQCPGARGAVVGVIDWSRGSDADRRFDLATGLFNLRHNLRDAAHLTTVPGAYGYEEPVETLQIV
jgi:aminoglycoside phosphotransferase (APT) family kinase protein